MVAPFALAYQPEGAEWSDATLTDFWTGVALILVSVVGAVSYSRGLVEELRARGILPRRHEHPSAPQASPDELERALMPLIGAMLRDMQEERQRRNRAGRPEGGEQR